MQYQKTIKKAVSWRGIGVHSGQFAMVTVLPAEANAGIVFYNPDYSQKIVVGTVVPEPAMHATVIRNAAAWSISTVEHIMAALYALGIDNVIMVTEGGEIPILDGSALPFVLGLSEAGIVEIVGASRHYLTPLAPVVLADQSGRIIEVFPSLSEERSLTINYQAAFDHYLIGVWKGSCVLTSDYFIEHIAPARTFGFIDQLPMLRSHGLARGASLGNTLVIAEEEMINEQRLVDECPRHKLLDFIGDIALLGKPLIGRIKATKTGHSFNRLLIQHYLNNPTLWQIVF